MNTSKIGFGVIGCGLVSSFHAKSIEAIPDAQIVASTDLDVERARKFVSQFGGEAISDVDELLQREDVDVVNVLTPNAHHEQYVIKAAQAGKHVIVEKPIEMTLEKADRMIKACRSAGVKLAVCQQVRFRKAIDAIKRAIDDGRFGKLLHGDAYMKWFRPREYYHTDPWRSSWEEGAGVVVQHAFHYLDLLYYIMGPVKSIWARTTNLAHPDVDLEDTAVAILTYSNGARGVLQASTALYPGTDIRIEINGEKGTAIMEGERITCWQFAEDSAEDEDARSIGSGAVATAAGGAADFAYFEHQWLIEDMIRAIRTDRQPRIPGEEGRRSLQLALAVYESADSGHEVEL